MENMEKAFRNTPMIICCSYMTASLNVIKCYTGHNQQILRRYFYLENNFQILFLNDNEISWE